MRYLASGCRLGTNRVGPQRRSSFTFHSGNVILMQTQSNSVRHRHPGVLPRLNVEPALLAGLMEEIEARNAADATLPGRPALKIAATRAEMADAARLMAQAFVRNHDKAWLAWLPAQDMARLRSGDMATAEKKIARVICYLCHAAAFAGGVMTLEFADESGTSGAPGGRVLRGASLRSLPPAVPRSEPWWHLVVIGASTALRSYGPRRAVAAAKASNALVQAAREATTESRVPARCIHAQMSCVRPQYQGLGVSRRMFEPFRTLSDRFGLAARMESSSPDSNDERVFAKFGFEKIGEHQYGASRYNNVGPYTVNLMVRWPRSPRTT